MCRYCRLITSLIVRSSSQCNVVSDAGAEAYGQVRRILTHKGADGVEYDSVVLITVILSSIRYVWLDIARLLPLADGPDKDSGCPRYKFGVLLHRSVRLLSLHPPGIVARSAHIVHACRFDSSALEITFARST